MQGEEEVSQALAPRQPVQPYRVDEYPGCPSNWPKSEGTLSSWFAPVNTGDMLWMDFNNTMMGTPYDVALIISIQGVNAITGQKTAWVGLEQYTEKCPTHKVAFGHDRYCPKCKFNWPKQNYLASTGQPQGQLWIDGFRTAEGMIREYVVAEEASKGVANAKIGETRTFSIGIQVHLSKSQRPVQPTVGRGVTIGDGSPVTDGMSVETFPIPKGATASLGHITATGHTAGGSAGQYASVNVSNTVESGYIGSPFSLQRMLKETGTEGAKCGNKDKELKETFNSYVPGASAGMTLGAPVSDEVGMRMASSVAPVGKLMYAAPIQTTKDLEIGKGIKVDQKFHDDPNGLDFWREKAEATLVINYAATVDVDAILAQGRVEREVKEEGILDKVPSAV